MTNIFARKPNKLPALPSRRYTLWIDLFEQKVAEAQQQIKELTSLERPYNLMKEFLELKGLPNDSKLDTGHHTINLGITALPTNSSADIRKFRDELQAYLIKNAFMKADAMYAESICGLWKDWDYRFYRQGGYPCIVVSWKLPESGLSDMALVTERKEVVTYDTRYSLVPRESIPRERKIVAEVDIPF